MDSGTERRLREQLRELTSLLTAGDVKAFGPRLAAIASPQLIQAAREGKLILKAAPAARPQVAASMVDAAGDVLPAPEQDIRRTSISTSG